MLSQQCVQQTCDAYYEDVFRFCLSRVGNADTAFDITQEVFLLLQEKRETLTQDHLKPWLLKTADYKIKAQRRSALRKLHREVDFSEAENELVAESDVLLAGAEMDETEIEALMQDVLQQLSAKDRELYRLRYQHQWKYAQIAEFYDSKERTVQVRTFRLRVKIEHIIKKVLSKREGI